MLDSRRRNMVEEEEVRTGAMNGVDSPEEVEADMEGVFMFCGIHLLGYVVDRERDEWAVLFRPC